MLADRHTPHVLVTRPGPAGRELCQRIDEMGYHAIHFPTIDFAPPQDMTAFDQAVNALGEMEWLLFVSPYAVIASVPAIRRAWPQFAPHVKFAAIGAGTAAALAEAGYEAIHPAEEWNSEGLLDMPDFQRPAGKKIAIIRGEGGREILDKILQERGAQVLPVIAYQRVLPSVDVQPVLRLMEAHEIDVIVCASFDAVRNLTILLKDADGEYLRRIPLIVMSERIKILAQDLGYQTIWITRNASQDAVLEILAQKRDDL